MHSALETTCSTEVPPLRAQLDGRERSPVLGHGSWPQFFHRLNGSRGGLLETGNHQLTPHLLLLLDGEMRSVCSSSKGPFPPTCSVLHRPPLHSHFRNRSNKRAIPITFADEIYDFVSDFLDRVSIIPYVFSRLEKKENCQMEGQGRTPQ